MDALIQAFIIAVPAYLLTPGIAFAVPKNSDFQTQAAAHALIFAGVHYMLHQLFAKF